MATNLIIARGAVDHVPPISLAFWRWAAVFFILFPFFFKKIYENKDLIKKLLAISKKLKKLVEHILLLHEQQ